MSLAIHNMKVSIITPAYNCAPYVAESIDSILKQTYENWELIIGDDGSTDETRRVIDSYHDSRIRTYHVDKNLGVLRMFNYLLERATGDFIMSHDADDISLPARMASQLQIFADFPEVGVCGTGGMLFATGKEARIANEEAVSGFVASDYTSLPFFPATLMYRREVYERVGGWHPFFDRLSSMDQYWIFLMSEKYKMYNLAELLYLARIHATSNHRSVQMTDIKKLASWDIYKELRRQREQTGTDWLEQGDLKAVESYVAKLGQNRSWLSEKYREYSAIRSDVGDTSNAVRLGIQAVWKWPWRSGNYRTLLYALRRALAVD